MLCNHHHYLYPTLWDEDDFLKFVLIHSCLCRYPALKKVSPSTSSGVRLSLHIVPSDLIASFVFWFYLRLLMYHRTY